MTDNRQDPKNQGPQQDKKNQPTWSEKDKDRRGQQHQGQQGQKDQDGTQRRQQQGEAGKGGAQQGGPAEYDKDEKSRGKDDANPDTKGGRRDQT